jgi:hypothetical protein
MSDESQLYVPPSFVALFVDPGRVKPRAPRSEIAARYELCEDLAQQLVDHANALLHGHGISEDEVLRRCHRGLANADSGIDTREAEWVVRRLAELLDWNCGDLFPVS